MIIIMGMPGAGKSTVLQNINNTKYKILNYGTIMFEIAKQKGFVKNRDEMRKLNPEIQKKIQKKAVSVIKKAGKNVILDTHCSISTPKGYLPGLPFNILKEFDVKHLVYITVEPEELIKRRKNDPTRTRDDEDIDKVTEHNNMNLSILASYAAFTGATIKIIYNKTGQLSKAVDELKSLL